WCPTGAEHGCHRSDGIPVARRDRYPEEAVDRSKVANHLQVAPVKAEHEPVLPLEDLEEPPATRREAHRQRRFRAGDARKSAREANEMGSERLVCERIVRHEPENPGGTEDNDFGGKGQLPRQLGAQLRPTDRLPDQKGTRRAYADGVEVL